MTDKTNITLNSQEVCPIIGDILNGMTVFEISSKRGINPTTSKKDAAIMATAYAGAGSIFAGSADAEIADFAEVADQFADLFLKAVKDKK